MWRVMTKQSVVAKLDAWDKDDGGATYGSGERQFHFSLFPPC